jgi:hypothetical protein
MVIMILPDSVGKGSGNPQKCTDARAWAAQYTTPARISDYIHPADDLEPGTKVIIVCRESTWSQELGGNLRDQERKMLHEARSRGLKVVGIDSHVGPGWHLCHLYGAMIDAEDRGAVLLAETVDRFIRPRHYHSANNPNAVPTMADMEDLARYAQGVKLYTIEHPDATPGQNRSAQTKRGQGPHGKDNRGGRPVRGREEFRLKWEPLAKELQEEGMVLRSIAEEITRKAGRRISHTSIGKWLRQRSKSGMGTRPSQRGIQQ